jgi:hypothetical protein
MSTQPYFANPPKQFPQRAPKPVPQATENLDDQLICKCGCQVFNPAGAVLFKKPGQVLGTVDITFKQVPYCVDCCEPINVNETKTRKELEKSEIKEGA